MNESCRDCEYFDDRGCTDKVSFCAMSNGPSPVSCREFEPINPKKANEPSSRFCVDCTHYQNILGFYVCGMAHKPGIACPAFRKKSTVAKITV